MKATEQYFPVVLFIMLFKVVLTFQSLDEMLNQYQVQHATDASELRVILKHIYWTRTEQVFSQFLQKLFAVQRTSQ